MKTVKGKPSGRFAPVIGIAARERRPFYARAGHIFVGETSGVHTLGYAGCVLSGPGSGLWQPDTVACADIDRIHEGDILRLTADGTAAVVWEAGSAQNAFLLTEACNCRCLMCPQPPKPHDPRTLAEAHAILTLLRGRNQEAMCITGGEPTLPGDGFIAFLGRCAAEHPEAEICVLTNGKTFADREFTRRVAAVASPKATFCVSLHGDVPALHDAVAGAAGSFAATEDGIYNLALHGLRIEIRHVVTRLNYRRLPQFALHLAAYFPFCSHYALMGMELCGCAATNMAEIGIAPHEYREELARAVLTLHRRGLPVSVYNVPLCQCDARARPFARQSISSWKNIYLPPCTRCSRQSACAGFFSTSSLLPLEHIQPFTEVNE